MKIRELYSKQFAGLCLDDPICFEDGVNVVCGRNESGKSTLVNLISRLLFQKAKLSGAAGKKFGEQYFPVARKGSSISGDNAEGKITLETDEGKFTLSKSWGVNFGTQLDTPDVTLKGQDKIDEIMNGILTYGEGVYSELLFSSQKNASEALNKLLDPVGMKDVKREITERISQAFAESDGISVDVIEQKIKEKIDELSGNWDVNRDVPKVKKTPGRWEKGNGEVLKAYYALEDAGKVRDDLNNLITKADQAAEEFREKDKSAEEAKKAYENYEKSVAALEKRSSLQKEFAAAGSTLEKMEAALTNWPRFETEYKEASQLSKELKDRELADLYKKVRKVQDDINQLTETLKDKACPEKTEIINVKRAQENKKAQESKLSRMNIAADIRMLGGNTLEVTSLRTGESVYFSEDHIDISEAVKIIVPGVLEMTLAPANVNVSDVQREIEFAECTVQQIFEKYNVKELAELEELADKMSEAMNALRSSKERQENLLNGQIFEEVEKAFQALEEEPLPLGEIRKKISMLCGDQTLTEFIAGRKAQIDYYSGDYVNLENLKKTADKTRNEQKRLEEELNKLPVIPEAYLKIDNPQEYLQELENRKKSKLDEQKKADVDKAVVNTQLEHYQDQLKVDPDEELERAEREFKEKKELLRHWMHISEKLKEQKEQIQEHPLTDLSEQFAKYLGIITGGRVSSELPDEDKLNVSILSNQRPMGYDLLSEGTKGTISLAFRLAVVDHLFPEGGGVIILDDPLTDMDEERAEQSCKLIREFAKRHQVIFLTCRENYHDKLEGNLIRI